MRIIYATDNYWPRVSGMAVSIDAYRNGLTKLGHEVFIFAPEYPYKNDLHNAQEKFVRRFPSIHLRFSKEDRLVSAFQRKAICDAIDDLNPDVIHVQTEFRMCIYVCRYARKKGIPLIATAHTIWREYVAYLPFYVPKFLRKSYGAYLHNRVYHHCNLVITP